jgi:DNA-binding FadR family transcriptional regulator
MVTDAPATRAQALAAAIERSIDADSLSAGDRLGTIEEWREKSGARRSRSR